MVNNYRWRTFGEGSGFGEQLRSGIIVLDIDEICKEMWMHTKLGTFAESCGLERKILDLKLRGKMVSSKK